MFVHRVSKCDSNLENWKDFCVAGCGTSIENKMYGKQEGQIERSCVHHISKYSNFGKIGKIFVSQIVGRKKRKRNKGIVRSSIKFQNSRKIFVL